jgi:leucyl-tRNA synthetase
LGLVNTPEPYAKRSAQGLILGPDGEKMSKSRGNVIDPLDIVEEYGADTLRTYVLFMGDYGVATPWNDSSMKGCKRFLERVAALTDKLSDAPINTELESKLHKTIKKVAADIEEMKFNTAIASLMTMVNDIYTVGSIDKESLKIFIKLLCPFAPHLCEELNEKLGNKTLLSLSAWPSYDEAKTVDSSVEVAVQISGKLRDVVTLPMNCDKDEALATAKALPKIAEQIAGKTIVKEIVVPNKIINIVVK